MGGERMQLVGRRVLVVGGALEVGEEEREYERRVGGSRRAVRQEWVSVQAVVRSSLT